MAIEIIPSTSESARVCIERAFHVGLSRLYESVGWDPSGSRTPELCEQMLKSTGFFVFAVQDNDVIGFGRLLIDVFAIGVFDVMVRPDMQRQGIGSAINRELVAHLDRLDRTAFLIDGSRRPGTYEKVGFEPAPEDLVMYRGRQA